MDQQVNALEPAAAETPRVIDTGYNLVVVHAFGPHSKGTMIADQALVAEILAGENAHFARKVFP